MTPKSQTQFILTILVFLFFVVSESQAKNESPYIKGRVIVTLKPGALTSSIVKAASGSSQGSSGSLSLDRLTAKHGAQFKRITHVANLKTLPRFAKLAALPAQQKDETYVMSYTSSTDPLKMADELRAMDDVVVYASADYVVSAQQIVKPSFNDPFLNSTNFINNTTDNMYGFKRIKAQEAMALTQGQGVVVAVLDTGVDYNHPELLANISINSKEVLNGLDDDGNGYVDDIRGMDFTTCGRMSSGECLQVKDITNDANDGNGHGTHVAGIIAAMGNNQFGMVGVAPQAHILPVKVLNADGNGLISDIMAGLSYAIDSANPSVHVINMSLGYMMGQPFQQGPFQSLFKEAKSKGIIIVVSAGNDSSDSQFYYPASDPDVITVAASNNKDERARFSNYGDVVDIAAPGKDIVSLNAARGENHIARWIKNNPTDALEAGMFTSSDQQFLVMSGTSMAAPYVSGVAALIKALHPTWGFDEVLADLKASADDDKVRPGQDCLFGAGIVNAQRALMIDDAIVTRFNSQLPDLIDPVRTPVVMFNASNANRVSILRGGYQQSKARWEDVSTITIKSDGSLSGYLDVKKWEADSYLLRVEKMGQDRYGQPIMFYDQQRFEIRPSRYKRLTKNWDNPYAIFNFTFAQLSGDWTAWFGPNQGSQALFYVNQHEPDLVHSYRFDGYPMSNIIMEGSSIMWLVKDVKQQARLIIYDTDLEIEKSIPFNTVIYEGTAIYKKGDKLYFIQEVLPFSVVDLKTGVIKKLADNVHGVTHLIPWGEKILMPAGDALYAKTMTDDLSGYEILFTLPYRKGMGTELHVSADKKIYLSITENNDPNISKEESLGYNVSGRLYVYDEKNKSLRPIKMLRPKEKFYSDTNPVLLGNRLVFQRLDRTGQFKFYSCVLNNEECQETSLDSSSADQYRPKSDGNRMVWGQYQAGRMSIESMRFNANVPVPQLDIAGPYRVNANKINQLFIRASSPINTPIESIQVVSTDMPKARFNNGWKERALWSWYTENADIGAHQMTLMATDANGLSVVKTVNMVVEPAFDLAINQVVISSELRAKKDALIAGVVTNVGKGEVIEQAVIEATIIHPQGIQTIVSNIPHPLKNQESYAFSLNWIPTYEGTYQIKVKVSVPKLDGDANPANNLFQKQVEVSPATPVILSGVLLNSLRQPISGYRMIIGTTIAVTDQNGVFIFKELPPGDYKIGVAKNPLFKAQAITLSSRDKMVYVIMTPEELTVSKRVL